MDMNLRRALRAAVAATALAVPARSQMEETAVETTVTERAPAATTTTTERTERRRDWGEVRRGLSLGGRGMYYKPDGAQGEWHGGAQLRFHLNRALALEGSADYRSTRFDAPAGTGEVRVDHYPVMASLLGYLFPHSPITPFVLAGAGWHFTHVDGPGIDETNNRFGPHAGGGLQAFLGRSWSLDGTYRYVWIEDYRSGAALGSKTFTDRGHMWTAALNYHF